MTIRTTTTLTSKGQLTVPKYVVTRLGLKPGARIEICAAGEDEFIATIRPRSRTPSSSR